MQTSCLPGVSSTGWNSTQNKKRKHRNRKTIIKMLIGRRAFVEGGQVEIAVEGVDTIRKSGLELVE